MGAPLIPIAAFPYDFRLKRYSSNLDKNCPSIPAPFRSTTNSAITSGCNVIILSYFENSSMKAHTYTPKNISAATVARTAVLGLALTNQLLSAAGKPVLPIESTQVEQLVSVGFTIGAALASWWYNNSFTQAAIKADEEFERQKKRV